MLELKKIAVTGGLGCGKTAVCRIFEKLGAYVVSADEIVHQLLSPDTTIGSQVITLIGPDIVTEGTINRETIAKKVFTQPHLLRDLEKILHPAVKDEIEKQYQHANQKATYALFVAEVPLLFESGMDTFFDATVAVLGHCRRSTEDSHQRMERQLSPEEKAKRATYIIDNSGALQDTEQQVKHIFNQLTK